MLVIPSKFELIMTWIRISFIEGSRIMKEISIVVKENLTEVTNKYNY